MPENNIVSIECDPDGYILNCIGIPLAEIRHEGGLPSVVRMVDKVCPSMGMVDEDPGKPHPRIYDNFELFGQEHGLQLRKRFGSDDQKLVVVCPDLETWLYERAREIDVEPENFGLPTTSRALHDMDGVEDNPNFQTFIAAIINHDGFAVLRQWLERD